MSEHTKGPWKVVYPSMNIMVAAKGGGCVVGSPSKRCAGYPSKIKGVPFDISDDQREANAQLIAAAPELLETLKDIALGQTQMPTAKYYEEHTVYIAKQAIAKATGGQK